MQSICLIKMVRVQSRWLQILAVKVACGMGIPRRVSPAKQWKVLVYSLLYTLHARW